MDETILVTGASEGLGASLALELAHRGFSLILVARNREKLELTRAGALQAGAPQVVCQPCDLGHPGEVAQLIQALSGVEIHGLVNNAGAGLVGPFSQTDGEREAGLVQLLVQTPLTLTKWLLGRWQGRGGRVLNVASSGAYQPGTFTSVYYASKAFISSWSQALVQELKSSSTRVSTVYPGALATGFAAKAGRGLSPGARKASWVAKLTIKAWLKGKKRIVPGWENRFLIGLSRVLPGGFTAALVGKIQGRGMTTGPKAG